MDDTIALVLYASLCMLVALSIIGVSMLFGPRRRKAGKLKPYECGMKPLQDADAPVAVRFYRTALAFVLFDVELLFLIPYAVSCRKLGLPGLWAVLIFVAVLGAGLLYAIGRGALEWD